MSLSPGVRRPIRHLWKGPAFFFSLFHPRLALVRECAHRTSSYIACLPAAVIIPSRHEVLPPAGRAAQAITRGMGTLLPELQALEGAVVQGTAAVRGRGAPVVSSWCCACFHSRSVCLRVDRVFTYQVVCTWYLVWSTRSHSG